MYNDAGFHNKIYQRVNIHWENNVGSGPARGIKFQKSKYCKMISRIYKLATFELRGSYIYGLDL